MAVQVLDEAAEAAEFAALVAELKAPEAGEDDSDGDEAAQEADSSGDPDEDEDPELEDEDEPAYRPGKGKKPPKKDEDEDEEESDDEELEDEDEGNELTAEETAAKVLFESGDIKAACKKLGIDPKIFKINARQFTAMRKGLADATKLSRDGSAALTQGQQLQTAAETTYGPIVAGFQAYRDGNPLNLRSAIELMCEDSFENVVATVARAAKGLDPAQVEVLKLRKELSEQKKADEVKAGKATEAAQEQAEIVRLTAKLKATPLAGVDGAAQEIRALVLASHKPGVGYSLTVQEAYAQVKAKHQKIAAAFSGKKEVKGKKNERTELAPIRKDPKTLTRAEREAAEREEFNAVLREAKDATKAGERRVRRTNGRR